MDYANIGSQEAGFSLLHGVEGMQGALGRRINGRPLTLPLLSPETASEDELRAAMIETLPLSSRTARPTDALALAHPRPLACQPRPPPPSLLLWQPLLQPLLLPLLLR